MTDFPPPIRRRRGDALADAIVATLNEKAREGRKWLDECQMATARTSGAGEAAASEPIVGNWHGAGTKRPVQRTRQGSRLHATATDRAMPRAVDVKGRPAAVNGGRPEMSR